MTFPPETIAALRRVAEQSAVEAADLVRERRRAGAEVADRKSSSTDIVTEVDHESEAFLRRRLAELRPDDGFVGEEGGRGASGTGITWVVDPIDGTVNFLYGLPLYAVSVAAVDGDDRSLAGAVVNVVSRELFSAGLGQGATLDGRALRVRDVVPMNQRLVITGYQYQERIRRLQGEAVARMIGRVRDVRRLGSAALDLCTVAAGRADGYVEEGLHLWDRAAGALVATEAGAAVSLHEGVGGMELILTAPAGGHDDLLALVGECGFLAGAAS